MTKPYRSPIAIAAEKRQRVEAARARRAAGLPTKAQPVPIAPPVPVEDPKVRQAEDQALADEIAQSTADAVSAYFNDTVIPAQVRAARQAGYASAEASKAATIEPEPMEVTIPHRGPDGRILYVTKHRVTDPAELENLVDDD